MSTKPTKPEPAATGEVVVENLRAAVYASHEEISVLVQADSGLDSKLLGLLGFFVAAAGILADLADTARRNRGGLERRDKALVFAIRGPVLFAIAYGLLSLT
jgi:hypothetical protein